MSGIDPTGGVTSAKGFRAAGVKAGVKYADRLDVALVASDRPCAAAGVFTTNQVFAAPVGFDRARLAKAPAAQCVAVNTGCANACTGEAGQEAAAAMAMGSAYLEYPVLLLTSTMTGRWESSCSTGTAERSRVFFVYVSKVLMPLSQSMTFSLPPAITCSALIRSSFKVVARPLFISTGLRVFPISKSSSVFCIFLAPTCMMSTSSNRAISFMLIISDMIGSPVCLFASASISMPSPLRPWKS